MEKTSYHIIGVMSGTSLDGIDLAEIKFNFAAGKWAFEILHAETVPYLDIWKNDLKKAITYSQTKLESLDFKYTELLAKVILKFIWKHRISELDAICSHGHTILHRPEKGFTLQIGNLPKLAKLVGQTVVCDFRVQDVALCGQGAPLVPIGDRLLFSQYNYCLILGGSANCSFEQNEKRIAYDICPVNIVLNHYSELLGRKYDDSGNLAASGALNNGLLAQLNSLDYYSKEPPKSLGFEWVRSIIFPMIETFDIPIIDILRTYTEHVAMQLSSQFAKNSNILVTGGGAYNSFLIQRMESLADLKVIIPSSEIVEFKEALIFGLLGVLKLRGEINTLASVTGAKRDHSTGKIFT